jgi:hypothetical protein
MLSFLLVLVRTTTKQANLIQHLVGSIGKTGKQEGQGQASSISYY